MGKKKSGGVMRLLSGGRLELLVAGLVGAVAGAMVMLMPIDVLENLVVDSGLPSVLPQAYPPLGTKAQLLIAAFAAAIGFVVVFGVMKLVDKASWLFEESDEDAEGKLAEQARPVEARRPTEESPRVRRRDQHPDAPARAPISASRELGDATEDAPRRGLFAKLRPQAPVEAEAAPAERLRRFRPAGEAPVETPKPSFADQMRAAIAEDDAEPRYEPMVDGPVADMDDMLDLTDPLEALGIADAISEPEIEVAAVVETAPVAAPAPVLAPAPAPVEIAEGHTEVTPVRAAPRWMDVAPEPVVEAPVPAPVVAEPVAFAPAPAPVAAPAPVQAPVEPEPVFAAQGDGETIADLIGRLERAVAIRMPGAAPVRTSRDVEPPAAVNETDEAPMDVRLRSALANLKRFAPQG